MHLETTPPAVTDRSAGPWYAGLTRYHWFVFLVAALGWLFDTMDQQLFLLARNPAIKSLLDTHAADPRIDKAAGFVTMIFMMGWALGGLGFGILGDRIGRARTMMLTILVYSLFTGLSALSYSVYDFALYRFLTGLGVGGEFAVGVALVAEVMPDRARPFALGWLQALSAVGNITAALISMVLGYLQTQRVISSSWQIMFVIGALPALMTVLVMRRLKEPERWKAAVAAETDPVEAAPAGTDGGAKPAAPAAHHKAGSLVELFGTPRWRHNAIVGMLLAFAGVVGLWGIGFFSFELIRSVLRKPFETGALQQGAAKDDRAFVRAAILSDKNLAAAAERVRPNALLDPDARLVYETALKLRTEKKPVSPAAVLAALSPSQRKELDPSLLGGLPATGASLMPKDERVETVVSRAKGIEGDLTWWVGIVSVLQNLGAFLGIYAFSRFTHYTGRKPAFAVAFVLAMASTAFTFWFLKSFSDVFWMIPIMGFCQLSLFGGYAIYFPELFPTRLRSTGTSFCYNVGRLVAAVGPLTLGLLASEVFTGPERLRYAGVTMCTFFLIGLVALPFAPETKGKPLPE